MVNISWRLHNIHAASTAHPLEMNILDETNMKHTNTDTKHEHAVRGGRAIGGKSAVVLLRNCRPTHPANRAPRGPELPSQRTHIVCWSTILVRSAGHMATCQCSEKTHQPVPVLAVLAALVARVVPVVPVVLVLVVLLPVVPDGREEEVGMGVAVCP